MPKFQRTAYGFFCCGAMKETDCPRKVSSPSEEPTGWRMLPPGKGLLSVAAGVKLPFVVVTIVVLWLKPSWFRIGFVEYLPVVASCAMVMGCTNIPKPPLMTVFPPSFPGD